MGSFIVKVAPGEDRYCVWSTVVDLPTAWGTRAELLELLVAQDERKEEFALPAIEERFARADITGTSSRHGEGAWTSSGFIVDNVGAEYGMWLNRTALGAFLDSYEHRDGEDHWDLTLLEID